MPTRISRLAGIVARVVCISLLALPLASTSAEAAVKHRKKALTKSGHSIKKHKLAADRHAKPKKQKVKAQAKKPAPSKAKAQAALPRKRAAAPSWTAEKVRQTMAAAAERRPRSAPAAPTGADEPPRRATDVCRRDGRIYLLADCNAPLPPALLAAAAD